MIVILFVFISTINTDITGIILDIINAFLSDLFLLYFPYNLIAIIDKTVEIDDIIPKFMLVLNTININIVIYVPSAPSLILYENI